MFLIKRSRPIYQGQFTKIYNHHCAVLYNTSAPEKCPYPTTNPPKLNTKKPSFTDTPEEYQKARPWSEVPGPSAFKLLTNTILPGGKYYKNGLKQLQEKLQREYGDVVKFPEMLGKKPFVFLFDADQVEKVYRNEGQYPYRKGFEFFEEFRRNSRPEIFNGMSGLTQDQGKEWKATRTMVNPVMMHPKTVKRYITTVDKINEDLITRIRSIQDDKGEVPGDFGNEMNKWALESIAYIALDQRLGLLGDTDPNSNGQKLIQCVHDFFDLSYKIELGPAIWKYFKTPGYHKLMNCLNNMTDIIISYIDKSILEINKNDKNATSSEESVLEKLLKIDKRVAIVMALDMLMAGVDTTSNTVLTLLYFLAVNPEKQAILRQEVFAKLPNKDSKLTEELMRNMPYLRACLKESQRMQPVVSSMLRKADKDIVLGGYQIPSDCQVVMAQFMMSNQENNFLRSNEFIPERFLSTEPYPELKARQPFAFVPFGFGPRICIGKRLAELEMETVVAKLIRNFEVQWHYGDMQYGSNTFLNAPAGDLKFRFVEVNE